MSLTWEHLGLLSSGLWVRPRLVASCLCLGAAATPAGLRLHQRRLGVLFQTRPSLSPPWLAAGKFQGACLHTSRPGGRVTGHVLDARTTMRLFSRGYAGFHWFWPSGLPQAVRPDAFITHLPLFLPWSPPWGRLGGFSQPKPLRFLLQWAGPP